MSDTTPDNGQIDRRRMLASMAAALAVHIVLLIAFALGMGASRVTLLPPVTIDLQAPAGGGSGEPSGAGGLTAGGPDTGAAVAPSAAPASASTEVAASSSSTGSRAPASGGFVIPTPRAQSIESNASSSSGPSFREAGGRTGVVQGIPSVPGPSTAPAVPPVQQGKGSGSASSSGAGAAETQRSGRGVLVPGSSGSASGSLDLSQLDKALARGGGAAGGSGSGRGSGASGTGAPGGTGTGGSGGTGTGGSGGTGTGGSGGTGPGGTGQGGTGWGSSGIGNGRVMVLSVLPKLPAWVSQQGLALSVKVAFTVLPDGVVSGANIEKSSGYADVDARVIEAIRVCLFNAVPGSAPVKGTIPYTVNVR